MLAFVSLFKVKSTFVCYLIPKLSLKKNISDTTQQLAVGISRSISFLSPNVNIIVRLEFDLAYFEVAV